MRRTLTSILLVAAASSGLFSQVLYVGNSGDDTVSTYVIDQQNGILTELLPRVPSTGSPSSVAIHPNGKFVYVTNSGNGNLGVNFPSIAIFGIDPATGALKPLDSVALTPGTGPQGAVIDPAGKFLFVANAGPTGAAGNVAVYSIDAATGNLTAVSGSPFAALPGANKMLVHPSGKFAYVSVVSAGAAGEIGAFNIGANGALTPITGSPFAARNNLVWMAMDRSGKFLFAIERQDNAVLVYSINPDTGALTQVGSTFPSGPGSVAGVTVDPAGKFLYVSIPGQGGVVTFSIGATGALTQVGNAGAVITANDVILDPSGKFLYVTGPQGNSVAALAIDATSGKLTPIPPQFFTAGNQPSRGAAVLLSPPVLPPLIVDNATNQFSVAPPGMPYAGVAQGSRFGISGKNLGPPVQVNSDTTLTTQLGGVSVQIRSGGVTTPALIVAASYGFVSVVIPSSTPLGDATVTLTNNGRTTAAVPITIVPVAPGIRTLNGAGDGPAKAYIVPPDAGLTPAVVQNPNALNQAAKPGQLMAVQGTGLGPANFDETQSGVLQEMDLAADVIVGNTVVPAVNTVRTNGSDFILFQLPDNTPEGCYVPVAVRASGMISNVGTISVSSTSSTCSDTTGLAASDIDLAQKSGGLRAGSINLTRFDLQPFGLMEDVSGNFGRYDFNSLLSSFSAPVGQGGGIRPGFPVPAFGTCTVSPGNPLRPNHPFDTRSDPVSPLFFNAGPALTINGPQGTFSMPAPDYDFSPDSDVLVPGSYSVDNGTGTQQVGAFKAALTMPPMLTWSNPPGFGASLDRTQDLTVTWSDGLADKEFVIIVGISSNQQATAGYLCAEKVSAGQFTIPAWVLSSIPASDQFDAGGGQQVPSGLIGVGTAPLTSVGRFSSPTLDFGQFTYEQATVNIVSYQ
jgi:uncharacterized protein (TIGR03437 family)